MGSIQHPYDSGSERERGEKRVKCERVEREKRSVCKGEKWVRGQERSTVSKRVIYSSKIITLKSLGTSG